MKKDDVVTIYNDPITEKYEEGKARLIEKRGESTFIWETEEVTMEAWLVEFLGNKYKGSDMWCARTIKRKENKNSY